MLTLWLVAALAGASVEDLAAQRDKAPRVVAARAERLSTLKEQFAAAGVPYPPRELYLRAFKKERELEVWARGEGAHARVLLIPFCAASGSLGPKRQRGDLQVPEGFYVIDRFNPTSNFELSLGLDYPNALDRALKRGGDAGGDIFIHGSCASIGCIAIEDAIRSVYTAALDTYVHTGGRAIPVHVFPMRMTAEALQGLATLAGADATLLAFWQNLAPGYAAFERTRRVPRVRVERGTWVYRVETSVGSPD